MVIPTTESGRGIVPDSRVFDIATVCVEAALNIELLELTQEGEVNEGLRHLSSIRLCSIVAALSDERAREELDLLPVPREKKLILVGDPPSTLAE